MKKQAFTGREFGVVYGEKARLSRTDEKILELLNQNARMPISIIARKIRLSRDLVKYRLRRLEKEKIITGYMPIINPPKIGYNTMIWVLFSLWNITLEKEKIFMKFLEMIPEIVYVTSTMGKWDYMITIYANDPGHFNNIMKKIREKFPEIIKDYDIITVVEETKWTHWPK